MRRHIKYFSYVMRHKWFVLLEGLKLGVPMWALILHDWDKFLPSSWFSYAKTFYTPSGEKIYDENFEFARYWARHQKINKHHYQYWCLLDGIPLRDLPNVILWDRGEIQILMQEEIEGQPNKYTDLTCDEIPRRHLLEMIADWKGAGRALGYHDTRAWYMKNRETIFLHTKSQAFVEIVLGV